MTLIATVLPAVVVGLSRVRSTAWALCESPMMARAMRIGIGLRISFLSASLKKWNSVLKIRGWNLPIGYEVTISVLFNLRPTFFLTYVKSDVFTTPSPFKSRFML